MTLLRSTPSATSSGRRGERGGREGRRGRGEREREGERGEGGGEKEGRRGRRGREAGWRERDARRKSLFDWPVAFTKVTLIVANCTFAKCSEEHVNHKK